MTSSCEPCLHDPRTWMHGERVRLPRLASGVLQLAMVILWGFRRAVKALGLHGRLVAGDGVGVELALIPGLHAGRARRNAT